MHKYPQNPHKTNGNTFSNKYLQTQQCSNTFLATKEIKGISCLFGSITKCLLSIFYVTTFCYFTSDSNVLVENSD